MKILKPIFIASIVAGILMIPALAIAALSDGLPSYWKFDESSGNAADSVGGNTLTNNNSTPFVAGKINNGADFESSSDQLFSIADASQSGLDFSTAFSFSFWSKLETELSSGGRYGFLNKDDGGSQRSFQIIYGNDSEVYTLAFYLFSNASGSNYIQPVWNISALGTATFKHLVFTYDESQSGAAKYRLYIDGVDQGDYDSIYSNSYGGSIANTTSAFEIGRRSGNFYDGILDEVAAYSRAITPSEVTSLYNGGAGCQHSFISCEATATSIISDYFFFE